MENAMKLLPRNLHVVTKPTKLVRPIGTSVQYVRYEPQENHLRFARQHDRSTGELEKLQPQYTWSQIIGGMVAGGILVFALVALFL